MNAWMTPEPVLPRGLPPEKSSGRRFVSDTTAVLTDFDRVGWQEFERLVAAGFRARGFAVEQTQDGADGGVDLHLFLGEERAAVQVKHYPTRQIGVDKVRALFGVLQLTGQTRGYLVSSGDFTQDAWAEAQRAGIVLLRGQDTLELVNEAVRAGLVVPQLVDDPAPGVPRCPICRRPMVVRHVKKGARAGEPFWGCPIFPDCHGMRQIAHSDTMRTPASASAPPPLPRTQAVSAPAPVSAAPPAPPRGPLAAPQPPCPAPAAPPRAGQTAPAMPYPQPLIAPPAAAPALRLPPEAYQPMRQPPPFHDSARSALAAAAGRPVAAPTAKPPRRRSAGQRLLIVLVQVVVLSFAAWFAINVAVPAMVKSSLSRPVASAHSASPTKR